MRFAWALGVSALLSVAQANVIGRQNNGNGNGNGNGNNGNGNGNGGDDEGGDEEDGPSFTSNPGPSSSSSTDGNNGDRDTTILITATVTADVSQATTTTTVDSTTTSTVTNVKTERVTDTVTSEVNVYTETVYTTTTVPAQNAAPQKREQAGELPANYPSIYTVLITPTNAPAAPEPTVGPNPAARRALEKRQTFTQFTTVTADNDGKAKTTTQTFTRKVVSIKAVDTTTTVHVQKFANAKSTTTVTSTATETADGEQTGIATGEPSGGNKSGSSSSGGLSTGAKAGIGAGVGVAGLAVIAGLLFCCLRKRRSPKADPDMMAGSSVVPVSGNGSTRPMSHASSGTYLTPSRAGAALPAKSSPEGYRGTAMGDGRTGYAKPDPYGAAYANAPSRSTTTTTGHRGGADSLPEHPVPGEMNTAAIGTGVSPMTGTPSPVPHPNQHMAPPMAGAAIPTSQPAQPSHPQAVELGSDNAAAAKWHNNDAAEIDSQPVMSHQSGPVYEMP